MRLVQCIGSSRRWSLRPLRSAARSPCRKPCWPASPTPLPGRSSTPPLRSLLQLTRTARRPRESPCSVSRRPAIRSKWTAARSATASCAIRRGAGPMRWTHGKAWKRHSVVRKAERRRFERRGLGARPGAARVTASAARRHSHCSPSRDCNFCRVPGIRSEPSSPHRTQLQRAAAGTIGAGVSRHNSIPIRSRARESPAAIRRSS